MDKDPTGWRDRLFTNYTAVPGVFVLYHIRKCDVCGCDTYCPTNALYMSHGDMAAQERKFATTGLTFRRELPAVGQDVVGDRVCEECYKKIC